MYSLLVKYSRLLNAVDGVLKSATGNFYPGTAGTSVFLAVTHCLSHVETIVASQTETVFMVFF